MILTLFCTQFIFTEHFNGCVWFVWDSEPEAAPLYAITAVAYTVPPSQCLDALCQTEQTETRTYV